MASSSFPAKKKKRKLTKECNNKGPCQGPGRKGIKREGLLPSNGKRSPVKKGGNTLATLRTKSNGNTHTPTEITVRKEREGLSLSEEKKNG